MKIPYIRTVALTLALGFTVQQAAAQTTRTWSGGGADNNWSTTGNWDTVPTSGNSLSFGGTTRTTANNDIASNFLVPNLTILGTATSGMTLQGSSVQLSGTSAEIKLASGAGNSSIDLDIVLGGASPDMDVADGRTLTINGAITTTSSTNRILTKRGLGTLVLTNTSNNWTPNTGAGNSQIQINQGTLSVSRIGDYGVTDSPLGPQNSNTDGNSIRLGSNTASGTLLYTGPGESTDRRFQIGAGNNVTNTGSGTIRNDGSGALIFTSPTFNSVNLNTTAIAARSLTLRGTNGGTIQGVIADNNTSGGGTIALIKADAGTWELQGNNTYTGGTTINAGTLLINNTAGSGTGTGNVTVANTATLGGNGTISGSVTVNNGGTLSPGNSAGLLTIGGNLTLNNTSNTLMEIGATTTRGGTFDAVDVGNTLTYSGNLTLSFASTYGVGTYSWDLFNFNSQSGNFANVLLTGAYADALTNSGGNWSLTSGDNTWAFAQSNGVLSLTVIPEPSAFALIASGLAALLALRRRTPRPGLQQTGMSFEITESR